MQLWIDFGRQGNSTKKVEAENVLPVDPSTNGRPLYYSLYRRLYDAFGGRNESADLSRVMKDLLVIKHTARN